MDNIEVAVSVIVPVYNGEEFIDSLIANLKSQTFRNFELVIVNDGSKDRTKEILDGLEEQELNFKHTVIHKENAGVSAARNDGIKAAKGEFICFIDVDDIISNDYLETLVNAAVKTNANIAVAWLTRSIEDFEKREKDVEFSQIPSTEFLRKFLYKGIKYTVCACIFRKTCFTNTGIEFPVGYRYSEDVYVLWQLFAREKSITEVCYKIYYYYNNPKSAMNKGIDISRLTAVELMKKLEPIMDELNPEFAIEFKKFAVARHNWSILWQAAIKTGSFKEFKEFCKHFEMKKELKKMLSYPELMLSLSSLIYIISPFIYYCFIRLIVLLKIK